MLINESLSVSFLCVLRRILRKKRENASPCRVDICYLDPRFQSQTMSQAQSAETRSPPAPRVGSRTCLSRPRASGRAQLPNANETGKNLGTHAIKMRWWVANALMHKRPQMMQANETSPRAVLCVADRARPPPQQVYVRVIMARVVQEGFASPPGASPAKAWRDAERRTCAPRFCLLFATRCRECRMRNFAEPKYLHL